MTFSRIGTAAFSLGLGAVLLPNFFFVVDGGQRVILFDRISGIKKKIYGEGMHFMVPLLQRAIFFDVKIKPRIIVTTTGSKDLQNVSLTLRLLHRPKVENLPQIFTNLGLDYDERILPSIGNEVLKSIVAQYDAEELITQREIVSAKIHEELVKRASDFNIILEDVSLTHLTFGAEFSRAVEEKLVAQQDAERAKFIVDKTEQEKFAAIIRAQAESKAANLISDAIDRVGPGIVKLRKIDAAKDISHVLSSSKNISYINPDIPLMFKID